MKDFSSPMNWLFKTPNGCGVSLLTDKKKKKKKIMSGFLLADKILFSLHTSYFRMQPRQCPVSKVCSLVIQSKIQSKWEKKKKKTIDKDITRLYSACSCEFGAVVRPLFNLP